MTEPLKAFLTNSDGYYIDSRYMRRIALIPTLDDQQSVHADSRGCLVIHDNLIVLIESWRIPNSCVEIWTYDVQQGALVHQYTAFNGKFAGKHTVSEVEQNVFNLSEGWIGLAKSDSSVVLDEFLRLCLDASSKGDPKAFEKVHSTNHYVVKRDESNNRGWFIQPRKTNEDPNGVTYQNFFREVKELSALNRS